MGEYISRFRQWMTGIMTYFQGFCFNIYVVLLSTQAFSMSGDARDHETRVHKA